MKICLMIGKQAGMIGLLACLRHDILGVVAYCEDTKLIANQLDIPLFDTIKSKWFQDELKQSDLLLCVHGVEIVPKEVFTLPKVALNIHPYLYKYPGADPVGRAVRDGTRRASVGVHYMTESIDGGEMLVEHFKNIAPHSVEQVYNKLYPLYAKAVGDALWLSLTQH